MAVPQIQTMNLTQLKKSKAARRTAINKVIVELDAAISAADSVAVEIALNQLLTKEVVLCSVNCALESLVDPDDLTDETLDNEAYADLIIAKKTSANIFLRAKNPVVPANVSSTASSLMPKVQSVVKLPKLQINKFDGTIMDWERFWGQFSVGIHSNATLSDIDKFNYLRGLLSPQANSTIQGLQLTAANYSVAIDLLQEKYGKTEALVAEHIRLLWATKCVHQIGNGQELRKMLETFQTHLFSLTALGTDVSAMGALLCQILLQSIPATLLLEWNRQTQRKSDSDLPKLMDFIRIELEGVEQTCRTLRGRNDSSKEADRRDSDRRKEYDYRSQNVSSSSLVAVDDVRKFSRASARKPFCVFCNDSVHFSSACNQVVSNYDRRNALRANRRCFKCLQKNHLTVDCPRDIQCKNCQKPHHTFLCWQRQSKAKSPQTSSAQVAIVKEDKDSRPKGQQESEAARNSVLVASTTSSAFGPTIPVLQTMRLWVRHSGGLHQVAVLIDGGSERSFVSQKLVEKLKLPKFDEEQLTVHAFGGNQARQKSFRVPLKLVGSNEVELSIVASQVSSICNGATLWESGCIENFLRSKRICAWSQSMGTGEVVPIDVLIGVDYYWRVVTGHMKRLTSSLMATQSIFGWLLQGTTEMQATRNSTVTMLVMTEPPPSTTMDQQLTMLWELDRAGTIRNEEQSLMTLQDIEVQRNYEATTTFVNGRYQVGIPWINNIDSLSNNYELAKERLKRLLLKLQKDPVMLERYRQGIYEYLNNGHTEEVSMEKDDSTPTYFMPHHPIVKEDRKTTKLRIVFDASSHEPSYKSLNDCQHVGPNVNPKIFDLLIRFRWAQIGMSSDIKQAFLQIELHTRDRDATRFLWTDKELKKGEEPTSLKVFRMCRVLFGMKASPYLLAATIRWHLKTHPSSSEELFRLVNDTIYVDDWVVSQASVQEAFQLSTKAEEVMRQGGMLLTKWATNSKELRQLWVEKGMVSSDEPVELLKVLGLIWNPATDLLTYKSSALQILIKVNSCTKREILKLLASIFDPLGFITPKTITAKCLLQDLWRLRLDWDDEIPVHFQETWRSWKEDLSLIDEISLPRCCAYESQASSAYQLHVFNDASPRSYGAAVFLRYRSANNTIKVDLVAAKARVAPLTLMSIPRLELMACLIGKRLSDNILQAWQRRDIHTFFWSDSKVALHWIADTPARWKVFVGRRVQEIQDNNELHEWNYCSTKTNIADCLTRGERLEKLCHNNAWWHGPEWLLQDVTSWKTMSSAENSEIELALSEEAKPTATSLLVTERKQLLDVNAYNDWRKLTRITAWICRFLHQCRTKENLRKNYLTYMEIKVVESYWFRVIQQEVFADEKISLVDNQPISTKSCIFPFRPWLDKEGLIRLGGRLKFTRWALEKQQPILLRDCHLVRLFILHCHIQTMHGGVQATLLKIRETAWILRGRQTVRKAIHGCMSCRKWTAKSVDVEEAPLPSARVIQSAPFSVSGVDFAGPLWVKNGNVQSKHYICLFTCAVTRAVHLELTSSVGIKPFLLALRRFFARRASCKILFSDNAATFKQASRLVVDSGINLENKDIQEQVTKSGVQWRFIAPLSPRWGGFYERMIGAVKRHLRRSLGSVFIDAEEMSTVLTEIEATLNNRPLVSLTEDTEDSDPLTPAHFLIGRTDTSLTDIFPNISTLPAKQLLWKRWKYRKRLMDNFWRQWQKEYVLQLQSFHKVNVPTVENPLKLGDVVLVKEDRAPRGQWKLAKIQELTEGRDGKIRSVMLKSSNGNLIRRAIPQICPLEVI